MNQIEQAELTFDFPVVAGRSKQYLEKELHAGRNDLYMVPVGDIEVLPNFNPRVRNEAFEEHVENLVALITANGFKRDKPLAAIVLLAEGQNKLFVYDGHCRLEATRRAISRGVQIEKLPVVVAPAGTTLEDLTASLVTSGFGKALTPFETGIVCKRLLGYGWTVAQIAEKFNFTTTYIEQLLTIMGAPLEVREMIQSGAVSVAVAGQALREHGDKVVQVLKGAEQTAKAAGKKRVTASHLPGKQFAKLVRQTAPQLYVASCQLVQDPGFGGLSAENREKILELVEMLKKADLELPANAQAGESEATGNNGVAEVGSGTVAQLEPEPQPESSEADEAAGSSSGSMRADFSMVGAASVEVRERLPE